MYDSFVFCNRFLTKKRAICRVAIWDPNRYPTLPPMWPFLGRIALAAARTGCIRRAPTSPINTSSPRLRTRPASEVICQNRAHPASPPRNLAAPESSIVWPPLCCWRAAVAQRACNALPTCTAAARAACGDCEARDLGRELRPRDYMQRTWRLSAPLPANSCRPRPSAPHHARVHTAGHRRVSPAQTTTPAHQRFPL